MRKSSIVQITIALAIALGYVYLFGVTGRVENVPEGETTSEEITVQAEETTTAAAPETNTAPQKKNPDISFPMYTSLNLDNDITQGGINLAFVEELAENISPLSDGAAVTAGLAAQEEPDETEPEETEAAVTEQETTTTTTTEETTTTTTEETTTEETTAVTEEETTEATTEASNETSSGMTFKVYDQITGSYVTGDAKDILAQVVMGEIRDVFNEEAIKAQAVAAYTYIKNYNDSGDVPNVAMAAPSEKMRKCVDEVFGQAVYYNGRLIQAVYSASTAGYTASSLAVWGVDYPYLQSVKSEQDAYDPYYGRTKSFSSEYIKDCVKKTTGIELTGDPSTWFQILDYVDNVYVGTISVGGQTTYINSSGKQRTITGRTMREDILDYGIYSSCFDLDYDPSSDQFTFTTYGYGHGVGLCQYGAHYLAEIYGYDYKQILEFYFQGAYVM